jgi:hypothetical protein
MDQTHQRCPLIDIPGEILLPAIRWGTDCVQLP